MEWSRGLESRRPKTSFATPFLPIMMDICGDLGANGVYIEKVPLQDTQKYEIEYPGAEKIVSRLHCPSDKPQNQLAFEENGVFFSNFSK